jgi:RNA polymerase sigma-70 factor (TIGR02957 family)
VSEDELLEELRPRAFAIAYRMLGSIAEAEDIVQEALIRVHRALEDGERIESPRAFVATVATRLAIDELRSARARRESYVGEWLPEPLVADATDDPADQAEMADSLSLAFLVLLESLSPEERAVLLLRDVFDYGYDEIASIVRKSEDNARQLAARARKRVDERRPRFESSREQRDKLASRFLAAAEEGDLGALETLLAHDVVLHGDGGGKAPAIARSLVGRSRVARTVVAWVRQRLKVPGTAVRPVEVNGQPGALLLDGDRKLVGVLALDIAGQQIRSVIGIVNPDKLQHLGPVGDLDAVLRRSLPPMHDDPQRHPTHASTTRATRPTEPSTTDKGGNR